jgi:hypothetical protein
VPIKKGLSKGEKYQLFRKPIVAIIYAAGYRKPKYRKNPLPLANRTFITSISE